jgi:hypothetical protein
LIPTAITSEESRIEADLELVNGDSVALPDVALAPEEPVIVTGPPPESNSVLTSEEEAELRRIKDLPKEVGVMLMTVGVLGFALPGVVGTPAMIAGGLVLWPRMFGKVENWFERKFPEVHKQSLHQIHRYLNDLERRYPESTNSKPEETHIAGSGDVQPSQ